jgi:hypothetical protein
MADQSFLNSPWVGLGAGLSIGAGAMIVFLAKWGAKLFGGIPINKVNQVDDCPFTKDHPTIQQFMGESLQDRHDMRGFLEDINAKVGTVGSDVSEMKGQLNLLLRGARVRWNGAMKEGDQ